MTAQLEQEFNELNPEDIDALWRHARARIQAGEWTEDLARIILRQVALFHGEEEVTSFSKRVVRELERVR